MLQRNLFLFLIHIYILKNVAAFHGDVVTNFQCKPCDTLHFCTDNRRTACPSQSTVAFSAHPSNLEDCICNNGFLRSNFSENNSGFECVQGNPPFYYIHGNAVECPVFTQTRVIQANSQSKCACIEGYVSRDKSNLLECTSCGEGTYNPHWNSTVCLNCPDFSHHHLSGSTNIVDCECEPGYTGPDGGPCAECSGGFFKAVPGNATCVACLSGQYSNGTAATQCHDCHANSDTLPHATLLSDCLCDPGFEPDGPGACRACAAGKFKNTSGNDVCQTCAPGTFEDEVQSTSCRACSENSAPVADHTRCECMKGYAGNHSISTPVCNACQSGQYSDELGQESCDECLDSLHVSAIASVAVAQCFCRAGYHGDQYGCTACVPGTYKDYHSENHDDDACDICPANTHSSEASTTLINCTCNAGFTADSDGEACTACAVGTFKNTTGTGACQQCAEDTFQNETGQTVCRECIIRSTTGGLTGQDSISDCICRTGSVRLGSEEDPFCSDCKPGEFASASGCQNCSATSYTLEPGATECIPCLNNSVANAARTGCLCNAGHTCTITQKIQADCKTVIDNYPLITTTQQVQDINRAMTCGSNANTACTITSHPHFQSQSCGNNVERSWMGVTDECKMPTNNHVAHRRNDLDVNQYQWYHWDFERAISIFRFEVKQVVCDSQRKKDNWYDATMIFTSSELKPGETEYDPADIIASIAITCPSYDTSTPPRCTVCGAWFDVDPPVQARYAILQYHESSLTDSVDDGIYVGHDFLYLEAPFFQTKCTNDPPIQCKDGDCVACVADHYKPTISFDSCTICQANAQSPEASTQEPDCKCNRGFVQDGPSACVGCIAGKYADQYDLNGLDALECVACDNYTYTPTVPAPDKEHCIACDLCGANEYWASGCRVPDENTNATCAACPVGLAGSEAADRDAMPESLHEGVDACVCLPGAYYNPVEFIPNVVDEGTNLALYKPSSNFALHPNQLVEINDNGIVYGKLNNGQVDNIGEIAQPTVYWWVNLESRHEIRKITFLQMGYDGVTTCNTEFWLGNTSNFDIAVPAKDEENRNLILGEDRGYMFSCVHPNAPGGGPSAPTIELHLKPAQVAQYVFVKGYTNPGRSYWRAYEVEVYAILQRTPGCDYCPDGSYKEAHGNQACTSCPIGTDTQSCQEANQNCDDFADCLCAVGFFFNETSNNCEACGVGTSKSTINSVDQCTVCPEIENSWDESGQQLIESAPYCTCNPGFRRTGYGLGHPCAPCPPGSFKDIGGDQACTPCPPGKYQDEHGATACKACQANSTSTSGLHRCTCDAGFQNSNGTHYDADGVTCQACESGVSFKEDNGMEACSPCTSLCNPETRFKTACLPHQDLQCQSCQYNSNMPYQNLEEYCYCNAGWEFNEDLEHVCDSCKKGKAKSTNLNNSIMCQPCVDGSTFAAADQATECQTCKLHCENNYQFNDQFYVTRECLATSDTQCTACQQCDPGQYELTGCGLEAANDRNDTVCASCPANFYCPGGDIRQPVSCGFQGTSLPGSDSPEDCSCSDGFFITCIPPPFRALQQYYHGSTDDFQWSGTQITMKRDAVNPLAFQLYQSTIQNLPDCITNNITSAYEIIPCKETHPNFYYEGWWKGAKDNTCENQLACFPQYKVDWSIYTNNGVQHGEVDFLFEQGNWDRTGNNFYSTIAGMSSGVVHYIVFGNPFDCATCSGCTPDNIFDLTPTCGVCGYDHYCFDGARYACPEHSFTHGTQSTHILDCQCRRGHHRVFDTDSSFTCPRCAPGDWCFNNLANNCSDDRMLTAHPAFSPFNCTCEDGWYNSDDNEKCLACPVNSFCMDGLRYNCSNDRWTENKLNQMSPDDCKCRPGTREIVESEDNATFHAFCEPCTNLTFCAGDGSVQHCPTNSYSTAFATSIHDCLCRAGYQPTNEDISLGCEVCASEFVKEHLGNHKCIDCTQCGINTFQMETCTTTNDRKCEPCQTCIAGMTFADPICDRLVDTTCTNCSVCNYTFQYQATACVPHTDTICDAIEYSSFDCAIDEYRGKHSHVTQSQCLPCQSKDILYFGHRLHEYTHSGDVYDDPYSCSIRCLGASKRRDMNNRSAGCETCETGNVLYRILQDFSDATPTECHFLCRPGYELRDGDCIRSALLGNSHLFLDIVDINSHNSHNTLQSHAYALSFKIQHYDLSRFAVVVGPSALQCDKYRTGNTCCFQKQWLISTREQAGISSDYDLCSEQFPIINSEKLQHDMLALYLTIDNLNHVATCQNTSTLGPTSGLLPSLNNTTPHIASKKCTFALSIIDMRQSYHASISVEIYLKQASTIVVLPQRHVYVPLDYIDVHVIPAFRSGAQHVVFSISTSMRNTYYENPVNVTMRVRYMQKYSLSSEEIENCARLSTFANNESLPPTSSFTMYPGQDATSHTFWKGLGHENMGPNVTVQVFFTLAPGNEKHVSEIASTHVVTLEGDNIFACNKPPTAKRFKKGRVFASRGLGNYSKSLLLSTESTEEPLFVPHPVSSFENVMPHGAGEIDKLVTAWGLANTIDITKIEFQQILIAYTTNLTWFHTQFQDMSIVGSNFYPRLDFTKDFRVECLNHPYQCYYEYALISPSLNNYHILAGCDASSQELARQWIYKSFHIFDDYDHVAMLCKMFDFYAPKATKAIFLHTEQHFHARGNAWFDKHQDIHSFFHIHMSFE